MVPLRGKAPVALATSSKEAGTSTNTVPSDDEPKSKGDGETPMEYEEMEEDRQLLSNHPAAGQQARDASSKEQQAQEDTDRATSHLAFLRECKSLSTMPTGLRSVTPF